MSGKEIKEYVIKHDDIYYNIIIIDKSNEKINFTDIKDNIDYEFVKLDEMIIGSGMILAYYKISEKK
jgi:hypothetical protein